MCGIMDGMKGAIKFLLLDILLIIAAGALAVVLMYVNGGDLDVLRNAAKSMDPGVLWNAAERRNQERIKVDNEVKAWKITNTIGDVAPAVVSAVEYGLDNRYPAQTAEGAARGLSVLMYHNVYDPYDPPAQRINNNYISKYVLEEQLKYLVEEGYEFPTWEEVRRYVDGEIDLPEKSVVLTFDDGADGFRKHGVPLLEKYGVNATAFIIVSKNGDKWVKNRKKYPHLDLESHSYDMHRPGGRVGHGGIMTAMTVEQMVEDLETSQEILGTSGALAYPFGDVDYLGNCRTAAEEAGFQVAFTTKYGKVYPEADPYLLPRMRVLGRNSLETFKRLL